MILTLLNKKEKGERVVCAIYPQIYEIAQKFFILYIYESRQNFSTWFWGSNGPLKKKVPRYLSEILSFCNYRPYNTKKLYFWGLKMSLRGTFLKKKGTPRGPFLVQGLIYEKVHFFLLKIFIFFAKKCQKGTFSKKKGTF